MSALKRALCAAALSVVAVSCAKGRERASASSAPSSSRAASAAVPTSAASAHGGATLARDNTLAAAEKATGEVGSARSCATPDALGLVRFDALRGANAVETQAIAAVRRELERVLEDPERYYATLETAEDLVIVELWYEGAFAAGHCAVRGNPDEKSRTMTYDVRRRRVVSTKVWQ